MLWTSLNFGKHKDKTLPQILFADPGWFFWAWEDGVFKSRSDGLKREAECIHAKATSIRIPQDGTEPRVVEYKFYYSNYTSVGFEIVEQSRPAHTGSTGTQRATHIDMQIPRRQRGYDKLGYKIFIQALKACLFHDESARMTKRRCEEFFDDDSNFHRNISG